MRRLRLNLQHCDAVMVGNEQQRHLLLNTMIEAGFDLRDSNPVLIVPLGADVVGPPQSDPMKSGWLTGNTRQRRWRTRTGCSTAWPAAETPVPTDPARIDWPPLWPRERQRCAVGDAGRPVSFRSRCSGTHCGDREGTFPSRIASRYRDRGEKILVSVHRWKGGAGKISLVGEDAECTGPAGQVAALFQGHPFQ